MNHTTPNKWIVFIQWIVALQWLRLVHSMFTQGVPHQSSFTAGESTGVLANLPGYEVILPPDVINYAAVLTNTFFYGSMAVGILLLGVGGWMLFHKPLRLRPVTLTIVVLLSGMLLHLIMYTVSPEANSLIGNTAFLMGLTHGVLALYYLVFRRYKQRHHGTNLHYSTERGID
ncbi:hypothetical protein BRC21_01890 [Candidatus Saccharibacteria bacterium SW_7_54_9]|nr:MAG: hypothetical protein BRC21_01890 [Candidatus Saccharibacteria bacterium SW_7_54_9]